MRPTARCRLTVLSGRCQDNQSAFPPEPEATTAEGGLLGHVITDQPSESMPCMHACMHGHAHSDMRINTQARVCTRAHPHVPTEDKYAWGTLSKTCPWTCVFARRIHIHSHACILHAEIDWTDGWMDGHIGHLRHITKDSPAARLANEDTQASR